MSSTVKADFDPDSIRLVLLDIDGTVFRRSEACPDAAESIRRIVDSGRSIRYLTNNSSARPQTLHEQLVSFDIPSDPTWIFTAGMAAAAHARDQDFHRCAAVGEPGLMEQIEATGLELVPIGESAPCLIAGICFTFDFDMLRRAADTIRNGAMLIGCNPDPTFPIEDGRLAPGAGSLIAAIESASGSRAIIVGKPEPALALAACQSAGETPSTTLVAGDRYDTDIVWGQRAGTATWLVLTGVSKQIPAGQAGSKTLRGLADRLTRS